MPHNPYDVPTPPSPVPSDRVMLTVARVLLALAVLAAIVGVCLAAPVPKPKDPPPPSLLGTWECCWHDYASRSEMYFAKDGTYWHHYLSGQHFEGTWWRAGDGSLMVRERHIPSDPTIPPGAWKTWSPYEAWDKENKSCSGDANGDYGSVVWGVRNKKMEGK